MFVFVRARILLFWKPGGDEEWTTSDNWDCVADIISFDNVTISSNCATTN